MMKKAKVKHRVMAFLFDWLIVYAFSLVVLALPIIKLISSIHNSVSSSELFSLFLTLIYLGLICFTFIIFYFIVIPIQLNGQTLGKKFFGLRMVKTNGEKVDYLTLIVRELIGKILIDFSTLGLSMITRFLVMIINKEHMSFHDTLASTIVIDID